MLFHTFVTNFIVLVMSIIEPMTCWRVPPLRLVRKRCLLIVFVMIRPWCLIALFYSHKVWFFANTNSNLVDFVIVFSRLRTILNRNLLVQLLLAWWQIESLVLSLTVLESLELNVVWLWGVRSDRWRRFSLKIYGSLREPRKLSSRLKRPIRIRSFCRNRNFTTY